MPEAFQAFTNMFAMEYDRIKGELANPDGSPVELESYLKMVHAYGEFDNKMEKDKKNYDLNETSKKLHEDAKTKEVIFCPKCGHKLIVQRSKDWSRLYAVYCPNCEFGMKVSYSMEKKN